MWNCVEESDLFGVMSLVSGLQYQTLILRDDSVNSQGAHRCWVKTTSVTAEICCYKSYSYTTIHIH